MIERILGTIGSAYPKIIERLTKVQGLICDVYYCKGINSEYGVQSNRMEYTDLPDEKDVKYLVLGLFKENFRGNGNVSFDTFFQDEMPHIITTKFREIPQNSKVVVKFHNAKMVFRTEIATIVPGLDGPIIIKHRLKPYT